MEEERKERTLRLLEHAAAERYGKAEATKIRPELEITAEAIATVEEFKLQQEEEPPTTTVLTQQETTPKNTHRK